MVTYIGQSLPMPDAFERVTGQVPFLINKELPGMLFAKVLRSPFPHARVLHVDTQAAEALPGVTAVLSRHDFGENSHLDPFYGSVLKDHQIVAVDKVRYVGDAVAAVAAVDSETAEAALELIEVTYEELPTVFDVFEAVDSEAPLVHEGLIKGYRGSPKNIGSNIFRSVQVRHGEVERGLAKSDHVFEHTFTCPTAHHATLEPHVAIAQFDKDGLTIYSATQAPYKVREKIALVFGLSPEQVRIIVPPVGGGFGAKSHLKIEGITAALAYKANGRPVKLILSRPESFTQITKHEATVTLRTGIMADGTIVARHLTIHWNAGAYSDTSPIVAKNGAITGFGPYRWQHAWADSHAIYTNMPPAGSFRGPAVIEVTWAGESQMDMIATELGLDPIAFRLKNLLRDGDAFVTGETMHGLHYVDLLEQAARKVGWGKADKGYGVAVTMKSTTTPSTSNADICLDRKGTCTLLTSTVELGQGSKIVLSQIAADALGIPLEQIGIIDPDTSQTRFDQATNSSRSTFSMGNALRRAATDLKQKIRELAGELWEVHPDDLVVDNGRVQVQGMPHYDLSWPEVLVQANQDELIGSATFVTKGGLDANYRGVATVHWHQGVGAAAVAVDKETGRIKVTDFYAGTYAGAVINPATAALQNEGNVIMGLGVTLAEEIHFDEGQVVNANLGDYLIPALPDLPLQLTTAEIEDVTGDGELHGVAESTIATVAPAVANAVAAAVGVRIHSLPLTAERVLQSIRERA